MRLGGSFALLLLILPAAVQAQFTYTTNNGMITITKYTGAGGAVTTLSTIHGLPVTSIGDYAFCDCSSPNARAAPSKDADSSRTERTQDENQHVNLRD
jgi:hypothetical protein